MSGPDGGAAIVQNKNGIKNLYGGSSDTPVPADYYGAWGVEIAIFRQSSGLWAVRGRTRCYFGGTSDAPVTR